MRDRRAVFGLAAALFAAACSAELEPANPPAIGQGPYGAGTTPSSSGAGTGASGAAAVQPRLAPAANGITRLSREEYRSTVRSLLGVDVGAAVELLPADSFTPFDNDYTLQVPSKALVEGLKAVAERAAEQVIAAPALRNTLVGCSPAGPGDARCFSEFVARFGRRALRRPLADAEVQAYASSFLPFATASNDFDVAVRMVVRAMLQDLEFVYRAEIGQPVAGQAGAFRLSDFELASRLSFLLWGEGPDDALLDLAASGQLGTDAGVRAAAERLLGDERGMRRLRRFHALWMGYETLPHAPELNAAMRAETDALVQRVVFEQQKPWLELFRADETKIDAQLARLYGMSGAPATGAAWLKYEAPERRGLLAHGSLLANGVTGTDTSPTRRGKFVQERLACTEIPPPPPEVKADQPPPATGGNDCKADRYAAHRNSPSCAGCHVLMDGIGFGLENFDARGAYRAHDDGKPVCTIDGKGELAGKGAFRGPAELSALLVASGSLSSCLLERLVQFGMGRGVLPADTDLLDALARQGGGAELQLRRLMLDWVSSEGFRTRVVDER